jgi:hypothetical protein
MNDATGMLDGWAMQLALRRVLGVEELLQECGLCLLSPGGSGHARWCQAAGVKGHDTLVHNRVKYALLAVLKYYLHSPVTDESYEPFLDSTKPERHIDLVLPAGAFPATGLDGSARRRPVMVDVSCVEAQCASHMYKSADDPFQCCNERAQTKLDHYSAYFEQDRYTLATLAIGSFGTVGEEGQRLIGAIAEEWAERAANTHTGAKALKSLALGRIRAKLSVALHMGLSERVRAYWARPGVRGNAGVGDSVRGKVYGRYGDGDEDEEEPPWESEF